MYKLRFFYDGQVVLMKDSRVLRDGFGRYCDVVYHKIAVGYWKNDVPYGKQIVYKKKLNNSIEIYKEGFFLGDWNKFQKAKILDSFSSSDQEIDWTGGLGFADNDGPHTQLNLSDPNELATLQ